MKNSILLSVVLLLSLSISDVVARPAKDSKLSIRELVDRHYGIDNFVFGASAQIGYFDRTGSKVVKRWIKEFSYNTPENDCKQNQLMGTPTSPWTPDGMLDHIEAARKYGQVMRSHGPISPQCSGWACDDNRTGDELKLMLELYMTNLAKCLEENSDVVLWMDVVNETFTQSVQRNGIGYDAKGKDVVYQPYDWFGPREGRGGWENPWPIIGFEEYRYGDEIFSAPRYIRMAFDIANKYAPSIKKIYNEHGGVINERAWNNIKKSVLYLRSQGVKIDGIGWQAHVSVGWEKDPEQIAALQGIIDWCYDNNLEFHITELDVAVTPFEEPGYNQEALESTREAQAETIGAVVETMLKNVGKGARGINMWVMTDRGGNRTFASLFDRDGNPNLAYYKVKELLIKYKLK